jgi:4'-phosphopantetheinyl transferase
VNEIGCDRPFPALLREFPLAPGRIHVMHADLERAPEELERLYETLADDERERAARFRFEIHRRRFIVARGFLRQALSVYLSTAPQDIRFGYGAKGKPQLVDDPLQFNLSHSEEIAVYAFACDMPLGIDVEHIRRLDDLEAIAQRFFSPGEWDAIELMPPEERIDAFFRCWTRKEAYIKATGDGLSYPLDQFEVSVSGPAEMLSVKNNPAEAAAWSMHDIALPQDYIGALAFRGTGFDIRGSYRP